MKDLDLNSLLNWDEVFQFGESTSKHCLMFNKEFLKNTCNGKYNEAIFEKNWDDYVIKPLQEKFPRLAGIIPYLDIRLRYMNEGDKNYLVVSPEYFILSIISAATGKISESDKYLEIAISLSNQEDKSAVLEALSGSVKVARDWVKSQRNTDPSKRNLFLINGNISNNGQEVDDLLKEGFLALNWTFKHIVELFSELCKPVDYRLFDSVYKDYYFLKLCHYVFYTDSDLLKPGEKNYEARPLIFLNNYRLLTEYLSEVNGHQYNCKIAVHNDKEDGIMTSEDILTYINFINNANKDREEYVQIVNKYHNYEELLQEKAKETWDKIKKERFKKKVECNWDIIPVKEGMGTGSTRVETGNKNASSKKENTAKLKKAYDILDSKLDVFSKEDCVHQLIGKNGFEGYLGFVYPNNIVVFERFYRVSRKNPNIKTPAINEAIYVMTTDNFEELSQCSKSEILSYIKDFNSKDVMRIYHTGNWQDRVRRIITSSNYDNNDLAIIDNITNNLAICEKDKEKKYE